MVNASPALARFLPSTQVDHVGRFGDTAGTADLGRASSIMARHSRAMLQASDHQDISPGSSEWPSGVNICPPWNPNPTHGPVRSVRSCGSMGNPPAG